MKKGIYNPFTERERNIASKHYSDLGAIGVAKLLPGRTRDVVKGWACRNGLKVSKEYRTRVAIAANKSWVRSEETRKRIGDGHRKYNPFHCKKCGKKISHHSIFCFKCISRHGAKNPNWKGGVGSLVSIVRPMLWPIWNYPIMQRDIFTCQICGDNKGHNLNVHHLRSYKSIRKKILNENPKFSLHVWEDRKKAAALIVADHNFEDGITLCKPCHILVHGKKPGELLEHPNAKGEDNQQPSWGNVIPFVPRKVQRLTVEDVTTNKTDTSARNTVKCKTVL